MTRHDHAHHSGRHRRTDRLLDHLLGLCREVRPVKVEEDDEGPHCRRRWRRRRWRRRRWRRWRSRTEGVAEADADRATRVIVAESPVAPDESGPSIVAEDVEPQTYNA